MYWNLTDLCKWSKRRHSGKTIRRKKERYENTFENKHPKWEEHGLYKEKLNVSSLMSQNGAFVWRLLYFDLLHSICSPCSHHWYIMSFTLLLFIPSALFALPVFPLNVNLFDIYSAGVTALGCIPTITFKLIFMP